jgi:hypothetical protein
LRRKLARERDQPRSLFRAEIVQQEDVRAALDGFT